MKTKVFYIVFLAVLLVSGRVIKKAGQMQNSNVVLDETMYVDATASVWTPAFAIDRGAYLSLLIEAFDDSTAGFASDSACVSIELYQVFPDTRNGVGYFNVFKSKAHPDSTYPGTDWFLFDSLHIADMDTLAAYTRDADSVTIRQEKTVIYGDSLVMADTNVVYGAQVYIDFAPDFAPALALKVTGKADNLTEGTGSRWRFKIIQMAGEPVETNE